MKSIAFDTQSAGFDTLSKTKLQKIDKKSIAFDKKSIAFDTKSNRNYRKSTRTHQEIVMKAFAFDKKSKALDMESIEIAEKRRKITKKPLGNQYHPTRITFDTKSKGIAKHR